MTTAATVVLTAKGRMSHFSQDGQTTICGQPVTETLGIIGEAYTVQGRDLIRWASCRKCEKHGARLAR